ncbi:MAG: TolC family protein [Bryobacterales bacterium]
MRPKQYLIAIAAMACAFQTANAERRPMPAKLTVQQAVQMALAVNPQIRRAEAAVNAARADLGMARADLLPTVMLTSYQSVQTVNLRAAGIDSSTFQGFGGQAIPELFGPFGTFDGRVQLDADVLNLPRQLRERAERSRVESKLSETGNARELIATQVVSQYIDALRAQAFEATAVQQLASARALLTITADRFQQGVASGLDQRRARAQAAAAQQFVYEAQTALEAAKLNLARSLNAEITSNYELADIDLYFDARAVDAAAAVQSALAARPDYKAAQAAVASARSNVRATQMARLPKLTFHADYGRSGRTVSTTKSTYNVRGNVAIPIYWGGRAEALRTGANSALQEAEASLEAIESQVEMDVRVAISAVDSARLQTQAAKEAVSLLEEEKDLSLTRFQEGFTDNSEVVVAQERLARAEQSRIRALFNLNMARIALHRAVGDAAAKYSGIGN